MLPKVAIVYLSYNSMSYLDEVFLSLENLNYPKDRLEIIVVDNASTDGSQDALRDVKGITYFPNAENTGFAEGNNLGMKHALLNDAEYVFLHNNDLRLDPDAINEAVALAESDKKIGSVQSLMTLWKHENVINSTGGMVHFLGFGFVRENGTTLEHSKAFDGEQIAYASGAAVLYRSSALKKVGLLDPFLFLYHEDLELGWRLRLSGFKNVLSMKSRAFHDYEFRRSISKFYWMERNRYLVHFFHLKLPTALLIFPLMLVMEVPLILFAMRGGWIKEKLLVYVNLLSPRTMLYAWKKRAESQKLRSVSDREIISMFTGKILHQETSSFLVNRVGNPLISLFWKALKSIIRW